MVVVVEIQVAVEDFVNMTTVTCRIAQFDCYQEKYRKPKHARTTTGDFTTGPFGSTFTTTPAATPATLATSSPIVHIPHADLDKFSLLVNLG